MAIPWTYAFAYNTGSTIDNTQQLGDLAIATGLTLGGSVEWWNGPDFQLGYVIARPVPAKTQPTPIGGLSAYTGFIRSDALTDTSYVTMANEFKNRFTNLPATGTFDNASQVATQANEDGLWTSWTPSIDQIIYSGNSYNSLWTSGETSVGNGILVTYFYNSDNLGIEINVDFGTANGRWVSTQMYNLTNVFSIDVNIDVQGSITTVLISDGENEYEIGYDSGSGSQTITCNITGSYNGYYYIMIKSLVSGTNTSGTINIYGVQIIYNDTFTPYPFPLWDNISVTDTPVVEWTYTWRQITNVSTQISVTPSYNPSNISLWYATSNTEPSPSTSNNPSTNGLTSIDNGVGFNVPSNYWLIFGATTVEVGNGVDLVELSNDTAGNSLGSFTVSWTET